MFTVLSPLFFGEMVETEHLPLRAAILVPNVPSRARSYEYQVYLGGGGRFRRREKFSPLSPHRFKPGTRLLGTFETKMAVRNVKLSIFTILGKKKGTGNILESRQGSGRGRLLFWVTFLRTKVQVTVLSLIISFPHDL